VGYGFVNLTSPEAAVRLYKAFHKQPWEVYNSRKICQVTYARVQVRTPLLQLPFSYIYIRRRHFNATYVLIAHMSMLQLCGGAGPGSAEGALQELQVPVRQRRVPARGVLAGARRQGAYGSSAHRGPLARGVVRVVASQEPGGQRGPAWAGADAGAVVIRGRRVVDHYVHPRAVRTRRGGGGGRHQARRRAAAAWLRRLAGSDPSCS
jgi:hypothetical protein